MDISLILPRLTNWPTPLVRYRGSTKTAGRNTENITAAIIKIKTMFKHSLKKILMSDFYISFSLKINLDINAKP